MKTRLHLAAAVLLLIILAILAWQFAPKESGMPSPPGSGPETAKPITPPPAAATPLPATAAPPAPAPAAQTATTDTASVKGSVIHEDNGGPITEFEVAYLEQTPVNGGVWKSILYAASTPWKSFSGQDGAFQLDDLPAGKSFALAAKADGFVPAYIPAPAIATGEAKEGMVIRLAPETGVSGRVVAADGAPIKGAAVHRGETEAGKMIARTDADGRFRATCAGGEKLVLCAAHPDYLPGTTEVLPRRGQILEIEIILNTGGTVAGTVLRGDAPLPNIAVTVYDPESGMTPKMVNTDKEGRYALKGLPAGELEVRAEASTDQDASSLSMQHRAMIAEGATTRVDLRFPNATGSINGVITAGGQPVAGGFVEVEAVGDEGDLFRGGRVGPGGEYQIQNLSAGEVWLNAMVEDAGGIQRKKQLKVTLVEGEQRVENIVFNGSSAVACEVKNIPENASAQVVLLQGKVDISPTDPKLEEIVEERTVMNKPLAESGAIQLDGVEPGDYTLVGVLFEKKEADPSGTGVVLNVISRPVKVEEGRAAAASLEF